MKIAALCVNLAVGLAGAEALAQDETIERLRACTSLPQAARVECLDRIARDLTAATPAGPSTSPSDRPPTEDPAGPAPHGSSWIFSQTTSPLDYSPVAIASASSALRPGDGMLQLSIGCRGGRSQMVFAGPFPSADADGTKISFASGDRPPTAIAVVAAQPGSGLAAKADVGRLLVSLPDRGLLRILVAARQGAMLEARFELEAMKAAIDRLSQPCGWRQGDAKGDTKGGDATPPTQHRKGGGTP